MNSIAEIFLVFFVLALTYTCFMVYTALRLYQSLKFVNNWKYARLIYSFQFMQLLFRSLSFWLVCVYSDDINSDDKSAFTIFSLPDSLIIASFITLFWVMITCTRHTRFDSEYISCGGNNLVRAGMITLLVLTIWILIEFMLYGLLYLNIVSKDVIGLQQTIICFTSSIIVATGLIIVQVKYSGLPFKTEQAGKYLKTVIFVTIVWTFGRILHGTFYFVRVKNINDNDTSKFTEIVEDTETIILIILDLLVTEIMCYFFILDYSFFRIFSSDFVDELAVNKLIVCDAISMHLAHSHESRDLEDYMSETASMVVLSDHKGRLGNLYVTKVNNSEYVVRKISLTRLNKYIQESIHSDIEEIKKLRIDHLCIYCSCNIIKNEVELVMPFYPMGSLHDILHNKNSNFTIGKKLEIAITLSETLSEIHSKNKAHGHLTSYNILMTSNFEPLIADLGLEHLKKFYGLTGGYCNKTAWSSPEILKDPGNVVTKPSFMDDVYSFGMIMWEMFFNTDPFPGFSLSQLRETVVKQGFRPGVNDFHPVEILELIKSCWNKDPSHRPDFDLITKTLTMVLVKLE